MKRRLERLFWLFLYMVGTALAGFYLGALVRVGLGL